MARILGFETRDGRYEIHCEGGSSWSLKNLSTGSITELSSYTTPVRMGSPFSGVRKGDGKPVKTSTITKVL